MIEKFDSDQKRSKFKEIFIITVSVMVLIIIASIALKLTTSKNNLFKESQRIKLIEK